jgi:DNA helicase MCM8
LQGIREIMCHDDPFHLIVNSLCPGIYGHELVKAGLCLALAGGVPKVCIESFVLVSFCV